MHLIVALLLTIGCSYDAQLQVRDEIRAKYPCWATYEDFETFLYAKSNKTRRLILDEHREEERWQYVKRVSMRTGFL